MVTFVRGSTVTFNATCTNSAGDAVEPDSANLYLRFMPAAAGPRTAVTIPMTVADNVVTASWDSSIAAADTIHWSIRTTGQDKIAQDGEISLTANEANPAA